MVARRTAPAREVLHARIILLTNEGLSNKEVAKRLSTCEHTVSYLAQTICARLGLEGLSEMPRAGAPRRISDEQVEKVLHHLGRNPAGCHPLEHAFFGCAGRTLSAGSPSHLAELLGSSLIARKSYFVKGSLLYRQGS